MKSFLVIQTAFIGDVILATSLVETIRKAVPGAEIDMVVRAGNESLLEGHPYLRRVIVWNKKEKKYRNLFKTIREVRSRRYDAVLNLQRFAASGWITCRSKANHKSGFRKNPFSFCYDFRIEHKIGNGCHEIERNWEVLRPLLDAPLQKPALYPRKADVAAVEALRLPGDYVVMAPASVWFTKQLPADQWVELIRKMPAGLSVLLIGAPSDKPLLDEIMTRAAREQVINLAGRLDLLSSAYLMKGARMNYVNDSAPLHLASAVNAPVTAFFCSTVPEFGFGPLSDRSVIVQVEGKLVCRPCGLHGFSQCPKGHFDCGNKIILPSVEG